MAQDAGGIDRNQAVSLEEAAAASNHIWVGLPTPILVPRRSQTKPLSEDTLDIKLHLIPHDKVACLAPLARQSLHRHTCLCLRLFPLIKLLRRWTAPNRKTRRLDVSPGKITVPVFPVVTTFLLLIAEPFGARTPTISRSS